MTGNWTSQELALKYAELEAELAAEQADKERMAANLEGEIARLGKQANDAIYKLAIAEAENEKLKEALNKIVVEGNKPDTQATSDEGLGPNPHTMAFMAEQALKGTE